MGFPALLAHEIQSEALISRTKMNMDIEPIDFKKLLREERLKARLERQRKQGDSATTSREPSATSSTGSSKSSAAAVTLVPEQHALLPPWKHSVPPLPVLDPSEHSILQDPPSIHYIPDFLPPHYQEKLVAWLSKLPQATSSSNDESEAVNRWTNLPHAKRRVALFVRHDDSSFPEPLEQLANALELAVRQDTASTITRLNHILVNEYQADQGILAHTDGPAYERCTATLSIGASVLFRLTPRATSETTTSQSSQQHSVLLQGGSLIVFRDRVYDDYLHSIAEGCFEETTDGTCLNAPANTAIERGFRISLTFRCKKEGVE